MSPAQRFLSRLLRRFFRDACHRQAAVLAYTSLVALVPLLAIVFYILAQLPFIQDRLQDLESLLLANLVPETGQALRGYIQAFVAKAAYLTWLGMIVLFFTVMILMSAVDRAINEIWRVTQRRRPVAGFAMYWAALFLGPLLIGLAFALFSWLATLPWLAPDSLIGQRLSPLNLLPVMLFTAGLSLVYKVVPRDSVAWRHAIWSGVTIAALLYLVKALFGMYVTSFGNYKVLYGAFAAVPVFLAWLYISWLVILLGAELTWCLGHGAESGSATADSESSA